MKVAWNRLGFLRWWAGEQRVSSATKNTGQSASKSSDTPQETKQQCTLCTISGKETRRSPKTLKSQMSGLCHKISTKTAVRPPRKTDRSRGLQSRTCSLQNMLSQLFATSVSTPRHRKNLCRFPKTPDVSHKTS